MGEELSMEKYLLRVKKIEINNFKNIRKGIINFTDKSVEKANICGIYGQNGSAKTAVVNSFELLKQAMCGGAISKAFLELINLESEYARFRYAFELKDKDGVYNIEYEMKIGKKISLLRGGESPDISKWIPAIFDEVLSYSYKGKDERIIKNTLISTKTDDDSIPFLPEVKYKSFFGDDKAAKAYLVFNRKVICHSSGSFIFSRELFGELKKQINNTVEYKNCIKILEKLIYYAKADLFVVGTYNSAAITENELPLYVKYNKDDDYSSGLVYFHLDKNTVLPEHQYKVIKSTVSKMNIVLKEIVPGLKIGLKDLDSTRLRNGNLARIVSIESYKSGKPIPLLYESEGIKKIISVLQLLIAVYNQQNVTIVIDELDSGIFEYLLGELLRIIKENGEGQLIFTSHNLRPLETLNKNSVIFTTTNPYNRYIRFTNVKTNNNLRDLYYRDILLGEQAEEIYAKTNNSEIAMAFREAGESDGT